MSYVIQNFSSYTTTLRITPRFKFIFYFLNISKFFFFYNENLFYFFFKKNNFLYLHFFNNFRKYFFFNQLKKIYKKINFEHVGFFDNKLTQSFAYNVFKKLQNNFFLYKFENFINKTFLYNIYLFPIKFLNVSLFNKYFKNLFFFFIFFYSSLKPITTFFFKFKKNFIYSQNSITLYSFYNGYFLNVYNF